MKGLIIKSPWIEKILNGYKIWEVRGSSTNIRGKVSLIKSGTGTVLGTAHLVDCIPLTRALYETSFAEHHIPSVYNSLPYRKPHAWVFEEAEWYENSIPYNHPQGAVIWVNLKEEEPT